ncbi:MAG: tobH protein [Rhodococcus sp. (in: high G+C Gram-positive bacteria)]
MTAPSAYVDLDDADAVMAADSHGALHSAALAGAQIRASAAAVREGALSALEGMRPRSVVFVAASGPARRAAELVTSIFGPSAGVPMVCLPATPPWVGPLDVVVVAGDDAGDPSIADSIAAGVRRRAEVVVAAPDEGPVSDAGAGRVLALPPRVRVLDRNTFSRYAAVMAAVLAAVDTASSVGDLDAVADAVDTEAMRHHASVEVFQNPAKGLASRMVGRRVLLTGDGVVSAVVARHGAAGLLRVAAVVAASAELADAVGAMHDLGRIGGAAPGDAAPGYDPLFHDEELDGPRPADPVRIFTVSTDPDDSMVRRRVAVLGEVDVVRADDVVSRVDDESAVPTAMSGSLTDVGTVLRQALILAVRLEAAAAYLQLSGGRA